MAIVIGEGFERLPQGFEALEGIERSGAAGREVHRGDALRGLLHVVGQGAVVAEGNEQGHAVEQAQGGRGEQ